MLASSRQGALCPAAGVWVLVSVPVSDVAGGALALAADVVAQAGVATRARPRAVDPEPAEGTRLSADGALRRHVTGRRGNRTSDRKRPKEPKKSLKSFCVPEEQRRQEVTQSFDLDTVTFFGFDLI